MSPYRDLEAALAAAGFTCRQGRHKVWRRGPVVVVTPRSPSDFRSLLNDRAIVRRALRRVGAEVTV